LSIGEKNSWLDSRVKGEPNFNSYWGGSLEVGNFEEETGSDDNGHLLQQRPASRHGKGILLPGGFSTGPANLRAPGFREGINLTKRVA